MKYKKIPKRVVDAFNDYGEKISYEIPTLADLIKQGMERSSGGIDDAYELAEKHEGLLDITDNLLMCATGWTLESLADNADRELLDLDEYIEQEIEDDHNCPFSETHSAFQYFARGGDNWNRQREVANEVFEVLFGESAEDMFLKIARAINEKLPKPDNKTNEKAEELTF